MTPMYIKMACVFCRKPLEYTIQGTGGVFDLYTCKSCQSPKYHTLYRQLYFFNKGDLLTDNIRIDEYYITRYFKPTHKSDRSNYTVIYKEALGVLENIPDMEPISLNKPVCDVNHIIDLPFDNLSLAKHKLDIWTTFS